VGAKLPILKISESDASAKQARAKLCALAVMAKAPRPGTVKTRLSPPLTPDQASDLNVCFLRDTSENIATVGRSGTAAALISYTPVGEESLFGGILPDDFALIAQRGTGFGERLRAAAEDILVCGFGAVCLIDGDSPTVPRSAFERAVQELGRPGDRIIVGPSADGGYYLIGLKQVHPTLFEHIAWSTDTVYADTLARAREVGLEVVELPLWYDIDDAATLEILRAELLDGIVPPFATLSGYGAPHTREYLRTLASVAKPSLRDVTD